MNLRDLGAGVWERSNRPARVAFVLVVIFLVCLLPFAGGTILATPIVAFDSFLSIQLQCLY